MISNKNFFNVLISGVFSTMRHFLILVIFLISVLQLILIGSILLKILNQTPRIFGASVSFNPQQKEDYLLNQTSSGLKFFFEPKPNSIQEEFVPITGEQINYRINSEGLREDKEYSETKNSDVIRIIALGDSFTFGMYVHPSENWVKQLEVLLNSRCKVKRFEVINLGVGGYDIQYSAERFKRRGQKLNPDLVIWLLKYDDFFFNKELLEERSAQLRKEMIESGEQKILESQGKYYEFLARAARELMKDVKPEEILESQIQEIGNVGTYYKGKLLLFPLQPDGTFRQYLVNFAQTKSSVFFFDGFPNFPTKDYYLPDGHPSAKGHEFIAQNLFEYLQDNKLISCM